jgi:drug/metabolite transporter (DMT)-like permease
MSAKKSAPVNRSSSEIGIIIQFLAGGLAWGGSFLLISISLQGLSPVQAVTGRTLFGAITLLFFVLITRQKLPKFGRIWGHFFVLAITFVVVPFLLFAWAQQSLNSGLASVFAASTPIATAVMVGLVFRVERILRGQALGLLLGLVGVVFIVSPWGLRDGENMLAEGALLLATTSYGFGFGYMRRYLSQTGLGAAAFMFIIMAISTLILVGLTPITGTPPMHLNGLVVGATVAVGAIGTGFAYVWNQNVVREWGAARASTIMFIVPVVGVSLGFIVLGETVLWNEFFGAAIVIFGVILAQRQNVSNGRKG